jgi:cobalt-zinc-cadmium efflux system membrane fusion protein
MTEPRPIPSKRNARAISRRVQWAIALSVAGIAVAAALIARSGTAGAQAEPGAAHVVPGATRAERPLPRGSFQISTAQAGSLQIEPVARRTFRSEQWADGRIALNGDRVTPVFSPYSGRVLRVLAHPGDRVRQGEPLMAVEASEFVQGQNDLLAALGTVRAAASQRTLAQAIEQRRHALYDAQGASLQDWQQSQNDLVSAETSLHAAETTLALLRNRLRILGRSEAEIAALERAGSIDPVALVRAPISGTVTDRQVGPGQYVQAGASTPVYSIGDLSTVWLLANVRENEAAALRLGQGVEVRIAALPNRIFRGQLGYIAPSIDPLTHRLTVRAELDNRDGALRPEMFASVTIVTSGGSQGLAVPEDAVIYEGATARVWVVLDPGTVASRTIRPGRTMQGMVEVLDGLAADARIVTHGTLFIDRAGTGD